MNQDTWTHTVTRAEYGTTGALGSPRAWLRRAYDAPSLDDATFQPGSLTPTEISIAGIWYKQPEGYGLPVTGMHRELFRFFEIPEPDKMMKPRTRTLLVPAIGVAAAVPMHEVLKWVKIYRDHGATFVWWNSPVNSSARAINPLSGKRERRHLDHAAVYKMLDAGKTKKEIAQLLGFPPENIDYVIKKWRLGLAAETDQNKPRIDVEALMRDYHGGSKASDLAVSYGTTPAYVYKLIKASKCQDLSQL